MNGVSKSSLTKGTDAEALVLFFLEDSAKANAWAAVLRLQWLLNSSASAQSDEDDLIRLALSEKFKTL